MSKTFNIQAFIMLSYLFLYVGASALLGEQGKGGIVTFLKALLLLLFFLVSRKQKIKSNIQPLKGIIIGLLFIMFLQLLFLQNLQVLKIVGMNLMAFMIFAFWSNEKLLNVWLWGIRIAALVASFSVAYLAYQYGNWTYLRHDALIDKPYITVLDSIAFLAIMADYKFSRNVVLNSLVFVPILIVDIMIVQSKISLFVLFVPMLIGFYIKNKFSIKEIFKYALIGIIVFFSVNALLPKDSMLLDPLKQGVNKLVGTEILEVKRHNMKTDTYDIRNEIWRYCMEDIFPEHPVVGIGLGNFAEYAKKGKTMIRGLEEPESSFLSIVTEGGIVYLVVVVIFFYKTISRSYRKLRVNLNYSDYIVLLFYSSYAVMVIGNDFLDSLFWIQAGIMASVLFEKKQSRPIS